MMVMQFGMSDTLGPRQLAGEPDAPREWSETMATTVDAEVQRLLAEARDRARRLLEQHRPVLDRLAAELVERETLGERDLAEIFESIA
jgi:cell division protease FtsH